MAAFLGSKQRGPQISAPGPGDQAQSMSLLSNAVSMIQQALPGLPSGSPIHTAVLRSLQQLSRHIGQAGQPGAGQQKTQLQDMLRNVMRNALMARISQGQGGGPGAPGGPGGAPGGPPPAPMPSTPLPGA